MISLAFCFSFIYGYLSFWIGLDIPYWIDHGIHYHQDHFHWSSTLEGDYCINPTLEPDQTTFKGVNLYSLSHDNTVANAEISRILLLSYPRSGNHLTRVMIECLLQIETYGYTKGIICASTVSEQLDRIYGLNGHQNPS